MCERTKEDKGQWTENGEGERGRTALTSIRYFKSERGVILVVVIVLSAVALALMTALIYMITTGTQISGLQKRYKTALEASEGGGDVFYQIIALRAETASTMTFTTTLNNFNLNSALTTTEGCNGLSSGATYTGFAAKLMTPSNSWSSGCNSSLTIDPDDPNSYDMRMELGTSTKYNVYAKIVAATEGNSGGDEGLVGQGVVASTGEVSVMPIPYLYAIEVLTENSARPEERAKLSVLYQY